MTFVSCVFYSCKHHYDNEGFEDYGSSDIKRRRMVGGFKIYMVDFSHK